MYQHGQRVLVARLSVCEADIGWLVALRPESFVQNVIEQWQFLKIIIYSTKKRNVPILT